MTAELDQIVFSGPKITDQTSWTIADKPEMPFVSLITEIEPVRPTEVRLYRAVAEDRVEKEMPQLSSETVTGQALGVEIQEPQTYVDNKSSIFDRIKEAFDNAKDRLSKLPLPAKVLPIALTAGATTMAFGPAGDFLSTAAFDVGVAVVAGLCLGGCVNLFFAGEGEVNKVFNRNLFKYSAIFFGITALAAEIVVPYSVECLFVAEFIFIPFIGIRLGLLNAFGVYENKDNKDKKDK